MKNNFSTLKNLLKKNKINNKQIICCLNDIKLYDDINQTFYLIKSYNHMIDLYFKKNIRTIFYLLKNNHVNIENLYDKLSVDLLKYGPGKIKPLFNELYKIFNNKFVITYNFSIKIVQKSLLYNSMYFIDDVLEACFNKFKNKDIYNFIKLSFDNLDISDIHERVFDSLCYINWTLYKLTKKSLIEIDELLSINILNVKDINFFSEPISQLLNALDENYFIKNKSYLLKSVKTFIDVIIDNPDNNVSSIFLLYDNILPVKYLIQKLQQRKNIDTNYYIKEFLSHHPDLNNIKGFI